MKNLLFIFLAVFVVNSAPAQVETPFGKKISPVDQKKQEPGEDAPAAAIETDSAAALPLGDFAWENSVWTIKGPIVAILLPGGEMRYSRNGKRFDYKWEEISRTQIVTDEGGRKPKHDLIVRDGKVEGMTSRWKYQGHVLSKAQLAKLKTAPAFAEVEKQYHGALRNALFSQNTKDKSALQAIATRAKRAGAQGTADTALQAIKTIDTDPPGKVIVLQNPAKNPRGAPEEKTRVEQALAALVEARNASVEAIKAPLSRLFRDNYVQITQNILGGDAGARMALTLETDVKD